MARRQPETPLSQPVIRVYINAVQQHGERWWSFANRLSHNYLLYLVQAVRNFITKGQNEAAGFAYWALFSLFPLVVLAIIISTMVLDVRNGRIQIFATLNQFIPSEATSLIRASLLKIVPQQNPYSLLSVLGLAFGAVRLFTNIQRSMSRIFRDDEKRPWLMQFVVGFVMMLTLGGLIIVSSLLSTLFRSITIDIAGPRNPFIQVGKTIALLIISVALFGMLFRYVPRRKIGWRAILPASLLGAIAWEVSRGLFDWYLQDVANLGIVYGSLTAVIGLLTWMFLIGCIISLCAEVAVATDDWQHARSPAVAIDVVAVNAPVEELPADLRDAVIVNADEATIPLENSPENEGAS